MAIRASCPLIVGVMQLTPPPLRDWSVDIQQNGREGTLTYRETAGAITVRWEFGGGPTLAILTVGTAAEWCAQHAWAAPRRAEIVQRIADEVVRQKALGGHATIDLAGGWVFLSAAATPQVPVGGYVVPRRAPLISKSKLMMILAIVVLSVVLVAGGLKSLFSIRVPHGSPYEDSARAGDEIVTMIHTLEAYVPTLHRAPGADRYRLSLFVQPLDPQKRGRLIPIARELEGGNFRLSRILGYDGTNVWLRAHDIIAVNLRTGKVRGTAELARANPAMHEAWDDARRFDFNGRLHLTAPDYRSAVTLDPVTLVAAPAPLLRRTSDSFLTPKIVDFLASGVRPTPTEWLGAHSTAEAEGYYKPGSLLSAFNRGDEAKQQRRLHRGTLGPEQSRGTREMLTLEAVAPTEYFNAAFLRSAPGAEPLRLTGPESFVLLYTSAPGLQGTVKLARVDAAGKVLWTADTPLDRFALRQILPDAHTLVLVGPRVPIPDKVPEPLLVFVDTQTGKMSTVSLWQ